MSNEVFPTLPGLTWDIEREDEWRNMNRESDSGRNFSRAMWTYPRRHYRLEYEYLSDDHLRTLAGFFSRHKGDFESWLFNDPIDNRAVSQTFGVGTGLQTSFQLVSSFGGYTLPVFDLNGAPQVFGNGGDWQGVYPYYDYARVNRARHSQDLAAWSNNNDDISIVANASAAPDGSITADKLVPSTSLNDHFIDSYDAFGGGEGYYTWSVYVKERGYDSIRLQVLYGSPGSNFLADFNLTTGVVSNVTGYVAAVGTVTAGMTPSAGGYWRVWVTGLVADTNAPTHRFQSIGPGGSTVFAGNGIDGVLLWGWQLEKTVAGASPTRYMYAAGAAPTNKVADFAVSATGLVTFSAPPPASTLTWSGGYYRRCKFKSGRMGFKQFLQDMHRSKSVEFMTYKP